MHIAMITSGGAGMFCGSCIHDNTCARALRRQGAAVTLIPTYTPIRVDDQDASIARVFFGGVNLYLEHRSRLWRRMPRFCREWLNRPWVLNCAGRFGLSSDAGRLGTLTHAMLQGETGPFQTQVDELAAFLHQRCRPDLICFSNVLLVGALRQIRAHFRGPIFCVLQGDDIFLEALSEPYRQLCRDEIRRRALQFDGFIVHSRYYRGFMAQYLELPEERFHVLPLSLDLAGHDGRPRSRTSHAGLTVGYFARICPEKGLHQLVEAVGLMQSRAGLRVGGYLGRLHRGYFREQRQKALMQGCSFEYCGSPNTQAQKVDFLKSLDVLSVPTEYREPKGLYVLEAWANGVPVVQPAHGAFPELIDATEGGLLFSPGNVSELARDLDRLARCDEERVALARAGYQGVRRLHDAETVAQSTLALFRQTMQQPL